MVGFMFYIYWRFTRIAFRGAMLFRVGFFGIPAYHKALEKWRRKEGQIVSVNSGSVSSIRVVKAIPLDENTNNAGWEEESLERC